MSDTAPLHEVTNADFKPAEKHCQKARQLVTNAVSTSGKSGSKVLNCPNCSKQFNFPSDLFRHVLMHTDERPYLCTVMGCEKGYTYTASLWTHYISHHRRGEVTWKRFDVIDDAKSHGSAAKRCKKEPNSETFRNSTAKFITTPLHEVTKEDFQAAEAYCKKARELVAKAVVINSQSSPEMIKCPNCPKLFRFRSRLFRHILVHTKEKPYLCRVVGCGAVFPYSSTLWRHYTTHRIRGEIKWNEFDNLLNPKSHGSQSPQCVPSVSSGTSSAVNTPPCVPKMSGNPDVEHAQLTSEQKSELQNILMDAAIGEEINQEVTNTRDGSGASQWDDSDLLPDMELEDGLGDLIIDPTDI